MIRSHTRPTRPTAWGRILSCAGLALVVGIAVAMPERAGAQQLTSSFAGFAADPDAPIAIEADRLDVDDTKKTAMFTGNVKASQGEFTIRSRELTVFYTGDAAAGGNTQAAAAPDAAAQNISRIVATGKVLVQNGPKVRATGSEANFDVAAQSITLSGDVVLSQDKNVLRGKTLVIDLTTGQSQLRGGRISGLFTRAPKPEEKAGDGATTGQ